MFHVISRQHSKLILFDFIKWPERDMSDWKGYTKRGAYLLNPPRLIKFLNIHFGKGCQKDYPPIHILTPSP